MHGPVTFPSVSVSSSRLRGFAWIWEIFSSRDCHIFPIRAFTGNFSALWAGKLSEGLEVIRKQSGKRYEIPKLNGLWKAMSAPLRMVRQVRDSCSVFHSSSLQPADLQKGHRAPSLNEQLHSRVRHLEFFCLFMSSNKGEEKNCVGMKCVRVAHICSPILYSLSSFHASVAF